MLGIGERHADADFFDSVHQHDVAGLRLLGLCALKPLEYQHLVHLGADWCATFVVRSAQHGNGLPGTDAAAIDAPDADAADVARIIERADLKLQRTVRIVGAHRHMRKDGFEQRPHAVALLFEAGGRPSFQRGGVNNREIHLLFGCAELVEEIEGVIHNPVRACARAIDFVDDDDRLQPLRQRLARDEARLRHRAIDRIDEQQHAVHHRQHALDFAAEIGVAGGVDDVDVRAFVRDRAVLGEDGDAALALEVVRVHHALDQVLVRGERAGLAQQLVDQRGLAVVDVGDDGDVADGTTRTRRAQRGAGRVVGERRGDFSIHAGGSERAAWVPRIRKKHISIARARPSSQKKLAISAA